MMTNKFLKILPIFFLSTFSYADPYVLPKEPYIKEHVVWLLGAFTKTMNGFKNHSERLLGDSFDKAYLGQTVGSEYDHKMALGFQCEAYRTANHGVDLIKRYPQYDLKTNADANTLLKAHANYERLIKTNLETGLHRCSYYTPE